MVSLDRYFENYSKLIRRCFWTLSHRKKCNRLEIAKKKYGNRNSIEIFCYIRSRTIPRRPKQSPQLKDSFDSSEVNNWQIRGPIANWQFVGSSGRPITHKGLSIPDM